MKYYVIRLYEVDQDIREVYVIEKNKTLALLKAIQNFPCVNNKYHHVEIVSVEHFKRR